MNEASLRTALYLTARTTFVFSLCARLPEMLCAIFGREQFQPGSHGNGTGSYWLQRHHILFIWQRSLLSYSNRLVTSADGTLVGGGSVYLLIYGLAIVAILRLRGRKEIFLFGRLKFEALAMYVIWLIFALAFVPRIISGWPVYSLLGFTALAALVVRIACLVRHRRAMAAAA